MPTPCPSAAPTPVAGRRAGNGAAGGRTELPEGDAVKAPMVGTFYRSPSPAPSPSSKSAACQGRRYALHHRSHEAAQRDRSRARGTIKAILVENGQPVEYGEPLFIIG
jgi:acetyl-CoA carboxylase biotin carboxyl carrier protein